ncbi:hypothetical protein [Ruegeria atlantica]|nr:hypothetical protein [Ruegeria atlantica]
MAGRAVMKRFEFDPYETLWRVRAKIEGRKRENASDTLLTANPAKVANQEGHEADGLAGLAISSTRQDKITDAVDHFEERAAIREYDGGQNRSEAKAAALIEAARAAGIVVTDLRTAIAARREGKAWER